jgi:hypothetical protein
MRLWRDVWAGKVLASQKQENGDVYQYRDVTDEVFVS